MTSSTWRTSALLVVLGFALSGMLTGGLMQADVIAYEEAFRLNHEQVSFWLSLFSVLTAGGGALAGYLSDRVGAGRVYRASTVLSGCGLTAFASTYAPATMAGFVAAGIGIGGLVVGNILVSDEDSSSPNRSLNRLHGSHGIARLLGVFLSIFAVGFVWQASYVVLGIAFVVLALAYLPHARPPAAQTGSSPPQVSSLNLWVVGTGFFLYMTAEMVLITWLPAYFEHGRNWSAAVSKASYGIFLAGLICGRYVSAERWPTELPPPVCRNLALLHAAALAGFLVSAHPAWMCLSLFIAGWCEGPGWPSLFAYAIRRSAGQEGKMTGIIYVVCCAGITISTAGSGVLAERAGLESIFYVTGMAHALFSVVFYWLLRSRG